MKMWKLARCVIRPEVSSALGWKRTRLCGMASAQGDSTVGSSLIPEDRENIGN